MLRAAEIDRLLSDLKGLQREVFSALGRHLIANRVGSAVRDFEHQPTVWDAYEGRARSQGWELPADFVALFEAWTGAYRRLADVCPQDEDDLEEATTAAEVASEALLEELYRCKDPRVGRLALALDLFAASEEIVRQNLRRQYPDGPPSLIERHLDEWIHRRPGAESGDGEGRPVTWPRTTS